jgi:hypothetical protein
VLTDIGALDLAVPPDCNGIRAHLREMYTAARLGDSGVFPSSGHAVFQAERSHLRAIKR